MHTNQLNAPAPLISAFIFADFVFFLSCLAQKALMKHAHQLNSVLIIGVKPVDPWQRQYLNENTKENYQGSATVPFPSQPVAASAFATRNGLAPLHSNSMPNGSCHESSRGASGAIASPAKSVLSKAMDLMFGL
jgi:nuclear pore complex protein Nup53